jgi:hypothetical protein
MLACTVGVMPRHDIDIAIPPKIVLNSDVRFVVRSDGEKLGELLVSRGSIAWVPGHSPNAIHLQWERFDQVMRDQRPGHRYR